jgi:peptide/nickel transport system ATP-binding protein/oligopeptide transport system ATP-binding protein
MNPLLDIHNLGVVFDTDDGTLTAVDEASFSINRGEVVGLVGESGCGKSVTAQTILRLLPRPPGRIISGEVLFHGTDLLRLPAAELRAVRGSRISMIFQEPMQALSPLHRVGDQLIEAIRLHRDIPVDEARAQAVAWLERVRIPDPGERMLAYPHHLSGGMLQRVMIAMALLLGPDLVIADEPTTALDVTVQAQILDLLRETRTRDTALLLITHDLGIVWEMCDRVIVMYAARVVEQGPIDQVFGSPAHPYTRALLDSVVSLTDGDRVLATIEGQVPSPLAYPAGCRFAPRCPLAFDRCRREQPPLMTLEENRQSACYLAASLVPAKGSTITNRTGVAP